MIYNKYHIKSDLITISVPAYNGKNDPENPNMARGVRKLIDVWNKIDGVSGGLAGDDYYHSGPNSKVSRIEVDASKFFNFYEWQDAHPFDNAQMSDFIRQVRQSPASQNLKKKP